MEIMTESSPSRILAISENRKPKAAIYIWKYVKHMRNMYNNLFNGESLATLHLKANDNN